MQRKGECLFAYDAPVAFQIQLSLTRTSVQRPLYRHDNVLVPTLKAVGIVIAEALYRHDKALVPTLKAVGNVIAEVLFRHDKMLVMFQVQFRLTVITNLIF